MWAAVCGTATLFDNSLGVFFELQALESQKTVSKNFPADSWLSNVYWWAIIDVSIPSSTIYSSTCNDTFFQQSDSFVNAAI